MRSSEASLGVAQANLKAADVAVDQTLIRAPFDGIVLTKNANVGDNITPFSQAADTKGAVVTIADMDTLEVEADVAESSLGKIKVGQPCEIQLDAVPDHRFPGVVNRIVPTVDRAKATVLVKIRFLERDERVLPDMSAKVAFLEREASAAERKPVTVVPRQAIVERAGEKAVFVVDGRPRGADEVDPGRTIGDAGPGERREAGRPGDREAPRPDRRRRAGEGRGQVTAQSEPQASVRRTRRRDPARAGARLAGVTVAVRSARSASRLQVLPARRAGRAGAARRQLRRRARRFPRADGAVRLGQVDAPQPDRRHRQARRRRGPRRRRGHHRARREPSSPTGAPAPSASSSSSTT